MYKMLLVEDEPIVRLALKSLVDWNAYGFDEVLEASNGKRALEIMTARGDIDIVITDINMPVMNGIELIEKGKKLGGNTEFLVLSAYDDYPLVRSAFKLGINDYILKTEMEPDKIVKMVMTALEKKDGGSNKRSTIDRNELIRKLIDGDLSKAELDHSILRLKGDYYLCCSILIDNFRIIKKRYEDNDLKELISSVVNAVYQVLETVNTGEIISLSSEEYGMIFAFESSMKSDIDKKLAEILSKIRTSLSNFLNIEVTIGISEMNKDIRKIKPLLEEGQRNARLRFIYGKGKNIYPKDEEEVNNMRKNKNNNITQQIIIEMGKENGILEALDRLDEEKCIEEMKRIFKLKELSFTGDIESFYIYYLEIILMIIQYVIKDEENNYESTILENTDFYGEIRKFDTIAEIEEWIIKLLKNIISSLRKMNMVESEAIKHAKDFIQKNYGAKLTLDMVSKEVGYSKAYFSKIFTEETGDNFTTYLTNIRIEKAKELLTKTEMKIYEICEHIGYSNIEHFSRTFKKIVGVSPIQYKNNYMGR
ncbi:putative response regulatory protein [Clostridium liquoris]|uniref:Stage 0 sporulation protein A homolog n=1 Tax=Clostridium liquoris TaxID=1289519 RepID=A0A2T0B5L9_9CLOT|nr:response regulator [Clostridium liquoris]PRR79162.1 putative response regulatory protein [Clostridium liquoris]